MESEELLQSHSSSSTSSSTSSSLFITTQQNSTNSSLKFNRYFKLIIVMHLLGLTSIALVLMWICKYLGGLDWTKPSSRFNYHVLLMIIGMVYLNGNAILVYRIFKKQITKYRLKLIHASLNLVIIVLSSIALYAVIDFHNQMNINNFYSLHSWLGIITLITINFQFFSGLITFLYPGLTPKTRKFLLPFHVFGGTATFLMAIGNYVFKKKTKQNLT